MKNYVKVLYEILTQNLGVYLMLLTWNLFSLRTQLYPSGNQAIAHRYLKLHISDRNVHFASKNYAIFTVKYAFLCEQWIEWKAYASTNGH